MPRTALVTGITGQDGSYLAELLLAKGYRVVGVTRRSAVQPGERLAHVAARLELQRADLLDGHALSRIVRDTRPDEVYHLAAQSVVHASWDDPVATAEHTAVGAVRLLEAVRDGAREARVLMASSSEIFGRPDTSPQSEATEIRPATPYGAAKAYAFWMTASYRGTHALHASSAILFNHESPRRGLDFVTRKITDGVARIATGLASELRLGNLEARRDWGFAGDYVAAMWAMLQRPAPGDLVIGTGESHSVREFCELAFAEAGLDYRRHVVEDERLLRPVDSATIVADRREAERQLGWRPTLPFGDLVRMMVRADLQRVRADAT